MPREFPFVIGRDAIGPFLESVRGALAAAGMPDSAWHDLDLALAEVMNNVILHGYRNEPGREVVVTAAVAGRTVTVECFDSGPEFNPLTAPRRDLDLLTEHGMGLHLVTSLMSQVAYRRLDDGRNRLTLTHRF